MRLRKAVIQLLRWERICRVATAARSGKPHLTPVCQASRTGRSTSLLATTAGKPRICGAIRGWRCLPTPTLKTGRACRGHDRGPGDVDRARTAVPEDPYAALSEVPAISERGGAGGRRLGDRRGHAGARCFLGRRLGRNGDLIELLLAKRTRSRFPSGR